METTATLAVHPAYSQIDNEVYNSNGDIWWDNNQVLYMLKTSVNPARVGYFKRMLQERGYQPRGKKALEVGCGGGILSEEFARMGFAVTGIDPSLPSLSVARDHAQRERLNIDYQPGIGEAIPFDQHSFDIVVCCDVLEHVQDVNRVIAEISRVLKPGGLFFFDTLNRTFLSKLIAIKIWQEWKSTAFMPPNLHVWEMFIKPREMEHFLRRNGLLPMGLSGAAPNVGPLAMIRTLRKRAKGKIGYRELGQSFCLVESHDKSIFYMGWATSVS